MHPQIARLNSSNLEVRYRASSEPQILHVTVQGTPKAVWPPDYGTRVADLVEAVNAGLAGGAEFPPEMGEAEVLEGPAPGKQGVGPTFVWKLRVAGIDPHWWTVALDQLADGWNVSNELVLGNRFQPTDEYYPKHVSIVGELPPDDSPLSVGTKEVIGFLHKPSAAYAVWKEIPFPVKETPPKVAVRVRLKVTRTDRKIEKALARATYQLGPTLEAHPDADYPQLLPTIASTKSQLLLSWSDGYPRPRSLARGPILNLLRRFHLRVTPIALVELELP